MVSSRLKEPWSAVAFASTCKEEVLRTVQGRYHDLEQHVRLRILLAALALRKGPAQAMAALLGRMAEDAQIDEDDWVQVFGHAVGDFTSPLWLSRVAENVPSVGDLLTEIKAEMDRVNLSERLSRMPELRPIEDKYLDSALLSYARPVAMERAHFTVRLEVSLDEGGRDSSTGAGAAPAPPNNNTSGLRIKLCHTSSASSLGSAGIDAPGGVGGGGDRNSPTAAAPLHRRAGSTCEGGDAPGGSAEMFLRKGSEALVNRALARDGSASSGLNRVTSLHRVGSGSMNKGGVRGSRVMMIEESEVKDRMKAQMDEPKVDAHTKRKKEEGRRKDGNKLRKMRGADSEVPYAAVAAVGSHNSVDEPEEGELANNPFLHTSAAALDGDDDDDEANGNAVKRLAGGATAVLPPFSRSLASQLPPKPPATTAVASTSAAARTVEQSPLAAALAKALGGRS